MRRAAVLSHDTREKKSAIQLRLHLTRTRRELETLRSRLTNWDPVEEAKVDQQQQVEEAELERQQLEADCGRSGKCGGAPAKKKKGRKGPETWKLRGAARPAHEVYEFDVRYVDPHQQALDRASEKSRRSVNVLALCKGHLSSILLRPARDRDDGAAGITEQNEDDLRVVMTPRLASFLRQYLSLLMQLGHLSLESKQYRSAREAWMQCVELEGTPAGASGICDDKDDPDRAVESAVTTARESLLRLSVQSEQYDAAWAFLSKRIPTDVSSFVAYTRAVVACRIGKKQPAAVDTNADADMEQYMVEAVRSNLYCAYYLAFLDTFREVMEYTEDLSERDEMPQTDLEFAIEYCTDDVLTHSWNSSGARTVLRRLLLDALAGRHPGLSPLDVDWRSRLARFQKELSATVPDDGTDVPEESGTTTNPPDVLMYARMFETAMEMLQESGQL